MPEKIHSEAVADDGADTNDIVKYPVDDPPTIHDFGHNAQLAGVVEFRPGVDTLKDESGTASTHEIIRQERRLDQLRAELNRREQSIRRQEQLAQQQQYLTAPRADVENASLIKHLGEITREKWQVDADRRDIEQKRIDDQFLEIRSEVRDLKDKVTALSLPLGEKLLKFGKSRPVEKLILVLFIVAIAWGGSTVIDYSATFENFKNWFGSMIVLKLESVATDAL